MKVLVFTTVWPSAGNPLHGVFVRERIRHLAPHAHLRVVAPVSWLRRRDPADFAPETWQGLRIEHPIFMYPPRFGKILDGVSLAASAFGAISRLRREFDFDLIDAHFAYPDGFAAMLLGRWFRRPVIVTMRGTEIPLGRFRLRRRAIQWTLQRAAGIIAVAHPLAEYASSLGVPEERVEVIENGVDIDRFAPRPQLEARRALGLPPEGRLLVSVGHLSRRKGFHRVLRVLPELIATWPDLRFAIVGGAGNEGNEEPLLRRIIHELHLGDRVILAGPTPPERVPLWLNAADVFVLPTDHEGCPNVVWEALACGCPVVASRVGDIQRMVPPHAGSLLADPYDRAELRESLDRALGRAWDRGAIREHAERHTWNRVALRVAAHWSRATGGRPAAAPAPAAPSATPTGRIPG